LDKAGSEAELRRWLKLAKLLPKGKVGRRELAGDKPLLPGLEMLCEVAKRERGLSRAAALRWFADAVSAKENRTGAVAARYRRKLGDPKVTKALKKIRRQLAKRGVDVLRFSLRAP
jgi:hypothetical protein